MQTAQFTPNLRADGTIAPWSFVQIDTTDNEGIQAGANDALIVGVTTGSTVAHNSANHAVDGGPIHLQTGFVMTVEAGGTVTPGALLESDADGHAVASTGTGTRNHVGIALENAVDGGRFRMFWRPQSVEAGS